VIPAAAGLTAGVIMMWAFGRLANRAALSGSFNRIQAHLLEFWLFVDEPSLVWQSWRGLLAANSRFLWALAGPLAILSAASVPLLLLLDTRYGLAPLPVGKPAVVTVTMEHLTPPPSLDVPEGVLLESAPVRIPGAHEVSWRIRPVRALSAALHCRIGGNSMEKGVEAGSGYRCISPRRTRSLAGWLLHPAESRLAPGAVRSIEMDYPSATVSLFGVAAHWSVWFLGFSVAGAILGSRLW
jgi:hypothetical protein